MSQRNILLVWIILISWSTYSVRMGLQGSWIDAVKKKMKIVEKEIFWHNEIVQNLYLNVWFLILKLFPAYWLLCIYMFIIFISILALFCLIATILKCISDAKICWKAFTKGKKLNSCDVTFQVYCTYPF